jgi:hypothetical protein
MACHANELHLNLALPSTDACIVCVAAAAAAGASWM